MAYIIFAIASAIIAVLFGGYTYYLHKQYPHTVKAKVQRIEKFDGKTWYHFMAKDKGVHILTDQSSYKDKPYKMNQKITVHMDPTGTKCMSNMPIYPAAVAIAALMLALVLVVGYFADIRHEEQVQEMENSLYVETGRFIITNEGAVLMEGENLGLFRIKDGDATGISTGDYGNVIYFGMPHVEDGQTLYDVHSAGMSVSEDGVPSELSEATTKSVADMGYTIDTTESVYVAPTMPEEEEVHDHDHDHEAEGEHVTEPAVEGETAPQDEAVAEDATNETIETNVESENTTEDVSKPEK